MAKLPKVKSKTTVTLPGSGFVVTIRKVAPGATALDATEHLLANSPLLAVAAQHAQTGEEMLEGIPNQAASRPTEKPTLGEKMQGDLEQVRTIRETQRRLVMAAVIDPPLADLLEAYDEDDEHTPEARLALHDLGLGPDFDFLVAAIQRHNTAGAGMTPEAAKRFLVEAGADPVRDGGSVGADAGAAAGRDGN